MTGRASAADEEMKQIQEQQHALLYEKPLSAPPVMRKRPASERRRRKGAQGS
jgi:hypothetical protein